ncbi:hypothetical protein Tco_1131530 [Tanacetum coccineum]
MLLDFDDIQDVSDEDIKVNKKEKEKVGDEDLGKLFKEVLKCPFTRRIVEFSSPGHRMSANAKVYDEMGDPEDHLTLDGKAYTKDPTETSKIKQRANETLPNFKERWVSESNAIPNVPELMQNSSFMSSHKCPELSKHFSDSTPKTVDEMLKRMDDYLQSKEAFRNTKLPKGEFQQKETLVQWGQRNDRHQGSLYGNHRRRSEHSAPQEILATEHQLRLPQPMSLVEAPIKENMNKYCDYHTEKGHSTNDCFHLKKQLEIALEYGKLNHLVKDMRQRGKGGQRNNGSKNGKWMNVPKTFPLVLARDLSEEALVVKAEVEGYLIRRVYIDEGASIEIMFEHCFNMLHPAMQARLVETQTTVSGFSGEHVKPLGKIELDVCFEGSGLCQRAIMKFTIILTPSPYNIILGRLSLKQLIAIPFAIHSNSLGNRNTGIPSTYSVRIQEGRKEASTRATRKD